MTTIALRQRLREKRETCDLRETFPDVPFVGMEPAVKPAAEHTQTGKVGVLATPNTFHRASGRIV